MPFQRTGCISLDDQADTCTNTPRRARLSPESSLRTRNIYSRGPYSGHAVIKDYELADRLLSGIGEQLDIPGGGDWVSERNQESVKRVKNWLRPAFEERDDTEDSGRYDLASEFETLLTNSLVEQQIFKCKQGFYTLGENRRFDGN